MRTPTSRADTAESGFTLLELLAVISILAVVAVWVTASSSGSLATARYRSVLLHTAELLGEGRTAARAGMTDRVFTVDIAKRVLGYPEQGRIISLPPGVELDAKLAEDERRDDGTYGIRFFGEGGSSGGSLTFRYRDLSYRIDVNWLTANVTTTRG